MLKRLRWILMGMGVGASASVWAQWRVKQLMKSYTPPEVAARAARRSQEAARRSQEAAGRTASDVRTALAEGRQAMRQREAELRHQIDQREKSRPPL